MTNLRSTDCGAGKGKLEIIVNHLILQERNLRTRKMKGLFWGHNKSQQQSMMALRSPNLLAMLIHRECPKERLQHLVTIYLSVNSTFSPIFVPEKIAQNDKICSRSTDIKRDREKKATFSCHISHVCVCVCVSMYYQSLICSQIQML